MRLGRMVAAPRTPGGQPNLIFQDVLFACNLDDAPDFKWKDPSGTIPCLRSDPPPPTPYSSSSSLYYCA